MPITVLALALTSSIQTSNTTAPAKYEHIVPRIHYPTGSLLSNLRYEGNNIEMRGPKNKSGNYIEGEIVAKRWRSAASQCKAIFVLRDSLYSQQDHPYRQVPYSILLPPNWIATAAHLTNKNKSILLPTVFDLYDDASWATIKTPQELFGSFPVSDSLFSRATGKFNNLVQRTNARLTILQLHKYAQQLAIASNKGPMHVLRIGAEILSTTDCNYFGQSARRNNIIPIFVEFPTAKEEREGKGTAPPHLNIAHNFIYTCTKVIYKRRLEDGDIAIERYDISNSVARSRAISLVEEIVPKGDKNSTKVWIWVTGPLDGNSKLKGSDAMPWIEDFKLSLQLSNANMQRVEVFSKPSISIPSVENRILFFNEKMQEFASSNNSMSLNLSTRAVRDLIDSSKQQEQLQITSQLR